MTCLKMVPLELFKVVPVKKTRSSRESRDESPLEEEIEQLPRLTQRKVKKLLACLKDADVHFDQAGFIKSRSDTLQHTILPYLLYAVKGKEKPADWNKFASILTLCKLPRDLLATRAQLDVRRARRYAEKASSDY